MITPYDPKYSREMVDIFYHTIHKVNIKDYTQKQIDAWAPESFLELEHWLNKWAKKPPIVACINGKVLGFAEFENTGYIDCFYVHHQHQGEGIGSALVAEIVRQAQIHCISNIYADVSITAKPFFQHKGFVVTRQQQLEKRGVLFENYRMERKLDF